MQLNHHVAAFNFTRFSSSHTISIAPAHGEIVRNAQQL